MGKLLDLAREQGLKKPTTQISPEDFDLSQDSEEQTKVDRSGLLESLAKASDATIGKVANFFFGTTAKAVSGVIGSGVESAFELAGVETKKTFTEQAEEDINPLNIGFTVLELYPGGKVLSSAMKATRFAPFIDDIGKILNKIPERLQASAVKQFSQALAPTTRSLKETAQKIVPDLLKKRISALTSTGLLNKATAELYAAGDAIDEVLKTIPESTTVRLSPVLDSLDDLVAKVTVDDTVIRPAVKKSVDDFRGILEELGDNVSFASLRQVRQILDDAVTEGGKAFGRTLGESTQLSIQRNTANAIRAELAKESPELARVNATYTLWKSLQEIMEETIKRRTGQQGALEKVATVGGAIAGSAGGGGILTIVGAGVLFKNISKLFSSTGWRTISAVKKAQLADSLASGKFDTALEITKRLLIGIKNTIDD